MPSLLLLWYYAGASTIGEVAEETWTLAVMQVAPDGLRPSCQRLKILQHFLWCRRIHNDAFVGSRVANTVLEEKYISRHVELLFPES